MEYLLETEATSIQPEELEVSEMLDHMATRHQEEASRRLRIHPDKFLLLMGIAIILVIRLANITNYNSLFIDEAIYAGVGKDALVGEYGRDALQWMFGSYLYPLMTGIANDMAGIYGMRLLSAVLLTITSIFIFLTARKLFGTVSALWAMLFFGLAGPAISLGQQAVIDAPAVAFMAASFYFLTRAVLASPEKRLKTYLFSSAAFLLAFLAKYVSLVYFPALVAIALLIGLAHKRDFRTSMKELLLMFILPISIGLLIYAAFTFKLPDYSTQINLFGQYTSQPAPRQQIWFTMVQELGLLFLFAIPGLLMAAFTAVFQHEKRREGVYLALAYLSIFAASMLLPLYHLYSSNARSLPKHLVFSAIFLAPVTGFAFGKLVELTRNFKGSYAAYIKFLGAAAAAAVTIAFVNNSVSRNQAFQQSWPNTTNIVDFMRTQQITTESRIMAPSASILEYYLDLGTSDHAVWSDVWGFEYGGLSGDEAILRAVADGYFDYIVIDNYYRPDITEALTTTAQEAGYTELFTDVNGDLLITTRVYGQPSQEQAKGGY